MLDAPVSGGVIGARTGLLAVMVGGDEALYQRVKPVLDAIGDNVVYCGASWHWLNLQTGAQHHLGDHQSGHHRAVHSHEACKALWETTRRGAFGRGAGGIHRLPESWFSGDFEPDWDKGFFATKLMRKDVGLATQLAREFQVPMALAALTEQELIEAMNHGWGDNPTTIVRLLQEERAGVQVRGTFRRVRAWSSKNNLGREGPPLMRPSADTVAGNRAPLSWRPSADAVAGRSMRTGAEYLESLRHGRKGDGRGGG